jgi:GAF domain-containing protein
METQSQDRTDQYRTAFYTDRAGLTVRVIPVLMFLAAIFAFLFFGVYRLLGRPMQWLIMVDSMAMTFCLFTIAYVLARKGHSGIAVYIVVIALNQLGAAGAVALEGWFAMSVLLAYVGLACTRLFSGRVQNWIVVIISIISVISQIIASYYAPIIKYTNPVLVQIVFWVGYTISGLSVVGYISAIEDKRQEQLMAQADHAADQLLGQTTVLENQTATLERRTAFLINVIKVIQDLGNPRQVSYMVDMIVKSIQKEFGFYHVAYYQLAGLLSPAVLISVAGEGTAQSRMEGFEVALDAQDPVAEVARLAQPRISGENDNSLSHIDIVKSRVTIPIGTSNSAVNGVLDIQDIDAERFQESELLLLQMLGEQLSLALESTYRFEDITRRFEKLTRVNRENTLSSWREWMDKRTDLAFRYQKDVALTEDHVLYPKVESALKQEAYSIPLTTIQGEVLGQVTARKIDSWNEDEISLLETLVEQVEQTLENARLFEAAEKRAVREQITRRITDSIRSAVSVEDAVRRAVSELAKVVDASEVSAQMMIVRDQQVIPGDKQ